MPKEGHISLEDLNWKFGWSVFPESLILYTEEENKFREEVRKVAEELILPRADRIDREADYDAIRDIYRELGRRGYLATVFPKETGGKGVVYRTIMAEERAAASLSYDVARCASTDLYGYPCSTSEQRNSTKNS